MKPGNRDSGGAARRVRKPPLRLFSTTLWEYPSQHYDEFVQDGEVKRSLRRMQGDKEYIGATPSWIVWQVLMRYTRPGDVVVDPMCGSGTTVDVCADLGRTARCFDLVARRPEITQSDARRLPLENASADFYFVDPPYSTHVDYSDHPDCIGKLPSSGEDEGEAYFRAMEGVLSEAYRVLKDRRYLALYVSDSFRKKTGKPGGEFSAIGFRLFEILARRMKPIDIVAVVRHNQKLGKGNWLKAAEEGNFFLRGFNYLLLFKKEERDQFQKPGKGDLGRQERPNSRR